MIRPFARLLRRFKPYRSGGVILPIRRDPDPDVIRVRLSPGRYEVSPEVEERFTPEVLAKLNQPPRP